MEFRQDGDNMNRGSGSDLNGIMVGSVLAKDDGNKAMILAALVIVVVFVIALIAFVMLTNNNNNKVVDRNYGGGTDIAAILATMVAAKGVENGSSNSNFDMMEIKNKLETSENRARETQTQQEVSNVKSEIGAVALMMQKTAADNEKDNQKELGEIKQQLGALTMGMSQVLQFQNNDAIIKGVIQQLRAC